jgi:hypothetical protein
MDRDHLIVYLGIAIVIIVFSVTLYFRSGAF